MEILITLAIISVPLIHILWDKYFRIYSLVYFGIENVQRVAKWVARAGFLSRRHDPPRVDKNQHPSAGGDQIRARTPKNSVSTIRLKNIEALMKWDHGPS
ncbi:MULTISPECIES: hypothetical protein [Klebsiella/Raoultella group]|uniref:hypothetical protein n=1 Tax=Klebsiella/Raoultella group TaxID=2890311 RepID=UPI0020C33A04|nr:hypothetical protein [Klebsiella michiganensis]MDS7768862.1 hypothetical protein [Klebsiella michiganensis]MDS7826622.1 hypothetical protein [Klebsiella michiganensis]UTJ60307.1 hypothetical protein NLZ14_28230 [Klebsiella michiganensis]